MRGQIPEALTWVFPTPRELHLSCAHHSVGTKKFISTFILWYLNLWSMWSLSWSSVCGGIHLFFPDAYPVVQTVLIKRSVGSSRIWGDVFYPLSCHVERSYFWAFCSVALCAMGPCSGHWTIPEASPQVELPERATPLLLSLLQFSWLLLVYVFSVNCRISLSSSRGEKAPGCFYLDHVKCINYVQKNWHLYDAASSYPWTRLSFQFQVLWKCFSFPPRGAHVL